jgi:hypothetical protein
MTDFKKAVLTGAILGLSLGLIANYAHASVARGDSGHHGYGAGVSGSLKGAASSNNASAGAAGQSGQGGAYFAPDLHSSLIDGYQPWPEAEMKQFQKN